MVVRSRPLVVTVVVVAAVVLIAATLGWWAAIRPVTGTPTAAPPSPDPAGVTIVPAPDATGVDPLSAVRVTAADGTLTDVPRLGYKEAINYAVRLSNDGIYIHQLDSTVWAQGNTNVSHGCLNVNSGNAQWFYDLSQPGDVVEVRNTGGQPLQVWQNGDWSLPWGKWLAGSAGE